LTVGIAYHLYQAFAVAQVDEDDAAVVSPAMSPAAERDGLFKLARIDEAAVMGAHFIFR
jgi:hypothetical protein